MKQYPLNVAVIGVGGIGRDQHLPAWQKLPGVRIIGVADISPAVLAVVGDLFGIEVRETDYRQLLKREDIDVIDICTPNAFHAEMTIAALEAGKHVLCEKPLATTAADARAMAAAAQTAGKKLMANQHLRFQPRALQLKALVDQKRLGDVYYARSQWLRRRMLPAKPGFIDHRLSGGGALLDIGVHMIDLAWWLMGCPPPHEVSAVTSNRLARRADLGSEWGSWDAAQIDVEDFAAGLIRFTGGAALSLEASWLGFQPEPEITRLHLLGTQGGAVWPDGLILGETDRIPWDLQLGPASGEKPHHESIRQFALSIVDHTPVPIPPEQSVQVVGLIESMYASASTGRAVACHRPNA